MGILMKAVGLLALAAMTAAAFGQESFPGLKGPNGRTGNNGNPSADNPGIAALSWYHTGGSLATLLPEVILTTTIGVGNQNGAASTANWKYPADAASTASGYYPGDSATTPYKYVASVPSALGGDPTVPLTGTADVFTWTVAPTSNTYAGTSTIPAPGDYRIHIWLPIGSTTDATDGVNFPQGSFVYKITDSAGNSYIDVVDRTSTTGWISLTQGTGSSVDLFHYDGVTPITVQLYNTIPRDSNGQLEGVGLASNGLPNKTYWVYADALLVTPNLSTSGGQPVIAPDPTNAPNGLRIFDTFNTRVDELMNGNLVQTTQGSVDALSSTIGSTASTKLWTFTVPDAANQYTAVDMPNAAVTIGPGWAQTYPSVPIYSQGMDYYVTPTTNNPLTTSQCLYQPTLRDGKYDVYIWIPGAQANYTYANQVQVEVDEGTTVHTYNVNLQGFNGYLRLGTGTFTNTSTEPLVVKISNYSTLAGDVGKYAYADAVRFVSTVNVAITSTPAYATVPVNVGTPSGVQLETKNVVIVAAEDGRIYCLDADGNGDGTTNIYWAYPSLPNPASPGTPDPNAVSGDGTGGTILATMPIGFGTSSPLIAEVPLGSGHYYCYIASTNGRVYCIDMEGRGDNNFAQQLAGTTTRIWSYPNDYPSTPVVSNLGAFTASLAFNYNTNGPTIFVPSSQGRMIALDAAGNAATRVTTVKWAYPALTSPTTGAITGTPAIDGTPAAIYYGTDVSTDGAPGAFYSLNVENGTANWGLTDPTYDSFDGGPTTAFNNMLGDGLNYIFASNRNGTIYAFSDTGSILWQTSELGTGVTGPMTLTYANVYDNTGVLGATAVPMLAVPGDDGTFWGLFAKQATTNVAGTRMAWFYESAADSISSGMAAGYNFLMGTDDSGIQYAFSNTPGFGSGGGPGEPGYPPNSPLAQSFGNLKVAFITPQAYQALTTGTATYAQVTDPANLRASGSAYDFGETMYVLVYDIPYSPGGSPQPPTLDFTFHGTGLTVNTPAGQARQCTGAPANEDGYVVMANPLVVNGKSAMVPGPGTVTFKINTIGPSGGQVAVVVNPALQNLSFSLANPLGIAMQPDPGNSIYGLVNDSLGASTASFAFASSPENEYNGGTAQFPLSRQMLTSTGSVADGTTGSQTIAVYDRSLMVLLNGPDLGGITNARVGRNTLSWQGGYGAVINPIGGPNGPYGSLAALDNFEEYPTNYPNDSLDYPNLAPDTVAVVKEPNGKTENPLFSGVSLESPQNVYQSDGSGGYTNQLVAGFDPTKRTPVPTPFEFQVSIPQYQPANLSTANDNVGTPMSTGYRGTQTVFLDRNNSGAFSGVNGGRDSYRIFSLGSGVPVKQHITVITPSIDFGSLAQGTGLTPTPTGSMPFTPWVTPGLPTVYTSFQAVNDGNTNLLNVRLAHATNAGATYLPWPFYSSGNDDLSWYDGSTDMWSDLDPTFSPSALSGILSRGEVFSIKPRTSDASGTNITTNPISRVTDLPLAAGYPVQNPKLAITPPIGTPVGQYSQFVRLIEDRSYASGSPTSVPGYDLSLDTSELYSDPTLKVAFTVTETRLTNSSSTNVATMADSLVPPGYKGAPLDGNIQPSAMRDLYGNIEAAWSSNRPAIGTGLLPSTTNSAYRLFFGGLAGVSPGASSGPNRFRDLNGFSNAASGANWFGVQGPYPTGPSISNAGAVNTFFGAGAAEHVIGTMTGETDTASFGNISFPSAGVVNPYNENLSFAQAYFAFTGSAQMATPTGTINVNRLFLGALTPVQGAAPTIAAPVPTPVISQSAISKPSVIETPTGATILYSTRDTGTDHLSYLVSQNGAFGTPTSIDLGSGFLSAADPSGIARVYNGADASISATSGAVIDFVFSGHVKGQANSEVFMARMPTDLNGVPNSSNAEGQPLSWFPAIANEPLTYLGSGQYLARGVDWNPQSPVILSIYTTSGTLVSSTNVTTSGNYDPNTGTFVATTGLGRVFLDGNTGIVRFSGVIPAQGQTVTLSYQAKIIRLTDAKEPTSFTRPTLSWDGHLAAVDKYSGKGVTTDRGWTSPTGGPVTLASTAVRNDRYIVTFDRGSSGVGQGATPEWMTLRIGLLASVGFPSNAAGPSQYGLYYTTADEGATITGPTGLTGTPSLVIERQPTPIPIDQPSNETQVFSFLDPFDPVTFSSRRPPLIWLFWTSSRGGSSDVYFETIAPALYQQSN